MPPERGTTPRGATCATPVPSKEISDGALEHDGDQKSRILACEATVGNKKSRAYRRLCSLCVVYSRVARSSLPRPSVQFIVSSSMKALLARQVVGRSSEHWWLLSDARG